jgi:hypothetical protein
MSFKLLGLHEKCSQIAVLKAWRRLARENHTDKTGTEDDTHMKALNEAKDQCLDDIIKRDHVALVQEFVRRMCKMANCMDIPVDFEAGDLFQPKLHEHFWIRTVDAMEWILKCSIGETSFDQTKEDEIPILCKYYNEFIGEDGWSDNDHAMMNVLNKYDEFKMGRYGNFAQLIQ